MLQAISNDALQEAYRYYVLCECLFANVSLSRRREKENQSKRGVFLFNKPLI